MNAIPNKAVKAYLKTLIDKVYKILPMKEENSETLHCYLSGLTHELVGCYQLYYELVDEPRFLSVVNIVKYLETNDYDTATCKREVFKAIKLIQNITKEG